jgi:hypothetical protein
VLTHIHTYNDSTQGSLRIGRYRVGLVQNDNFKGRIGIGLFIAATAAATVHVHGVVLFGKKALGRFIVIIATAHGQSGKVLDFITHDANAALIRRIQLQHSTLPLRGVPQLTAQRQCDRRLNVEAEESVREESIMATFYKHHALSLSLCRDVPFQIRAVHKRANGATDPWPRHFEASPPLRLDETLASSPWVGTVPPRDGSMQMMMKPP